jgi:hypothetical protein
MFQLSKEMVERISSLGKELERLIPLSTVRLWTGKEKELINETTGEIRKTKDSYVNVEVPQDMAERVLKALEYLKEANAKDPEFQHYVQVEIMDTKFNVIACYVSKVTEEWEIQLAKAFQPNTFNGIESDAFKSRFDALFGQRSEAKDAELADF